MIVSEQLASVNPIVKSGDTVTVNFEDGLSIEFQGATAMGNRIADGLGRETVRLILMGHMLARDPLLDSPELWAGKKLTLDVEQPVFANVAKLTTVP